MQFANLKKKVLAGVAVLVVTSAVASADVTNKKTTMTVKETIEVPGATLEPGEYVVKLVDSQSNRHIVQFLNKDEDEVLSTVIAIPNSRLEPTGETEFQWYETPAGQPAALRAWFYPGDNYGQEFAYPESRATELSEATKQEVPHISDDEAAKMADNRQQNDNNKEAVIAQAPAQQDRERQTAAATAAQQDRERQTTEAAAAQQDRERETAAQRERETAAQRERDMQMQRERQAAQTAQNQQRNADQNQTAQQAPQNQNQQRNADENLTAQQSSQNQQRNELPETAGFGALLALIGLGSLGASRAVRKLRNK